ncbi:MAG: deoxyguanosinetriphosphate triphosphohydrolase [Actinomycetota bacterium]|nr:deoxyguanosinetriphosphate triphosphohydrolase [Actinomycetota bacterium]
MTIREMLEKREKQLLSPRAQLSINSRGREKPLEPCVLRTSFQRDRDRIIHCKAFRRLSHKTQVFLSPEGDHYRTRLTHTLEVTQISRTIARALRLNEDLTEAIALGHDLGHTPFGHIGEDALSECLREIGGNDRWRDAPCAFKHNEQSLRVVDCIEYNGKGLNLTWEVRDGILCHTEEEFPSTLEGEIVRIADRIAYINHDIDDAVRGGIISTGDLPPHLVEVLGRSHGKRVNNMVMDMITSSMDEDKIGLSEPFRRAADELRDFLFQRVYTDSVAKAEEPKAKIVVKSLFYYYLERPEELPEEFRVENERELPLKVCDYVAGMTDRYAIRKYEEFSVPKSWMV